MKFERQFSEVISLIKKSRYNAFRAVNAELVNLYWMIGEYISKRISTEEWGKSVVQKLALHIERTEPDLKGYSDKNLWRMKQLYECYKDSPNLSALLREISWSHNLIIFSRCKTKEEREFYLLMSKRERFSFRELDRQISSGLYERMKIGNTKLSTVLRVLQNDDIQSFKDSYVFEFLKLPDTHNEKELQKALISQMKDFILELGKDYLFVGEEYPIQVGNSDFAIDLLFYHRGLQNLIALELKTEKFKPEFLGKLNFYLEALDRDIKKEHEKPSIGMLLCPEHDTAVVEYALSRSLSPTLVSQYQLQLPDKKLLKEKFHEIFENTGKQ